MENDFVMDFLLPLTMLGTYFTVGLFLVDRAFRVWAWVKGEKYESPWVW